MFIQVFQGKVTDPSVARSLIDEWHRDLAGGADGWLGTTAGVTADGELVAVVRFEDQEAAGRNSDRPEQGAWWERMAGVFDGGAEFHDYTDTALWREGGSDSAGFVQVIQGTYGGDGTPDEGLPDADSVVERRPEVLGGSLAWDDSRHFTQTVYFTSEEEARRGERATIEDDEARAELDEWASKVTGLRFLDITEPWLSSP